MQQHRHQFERVNLAKAYFLQVDSEIALTFSGIALQANDEEKRRRTAKIAQRAYDVILSLRKDVALNDVETKRLDTNLQRLKNELHSLAQWL